MKLVAEKVCKTIRDAEILRDINLELEEGTIYGFIGRNGSGKTMLFRALSGLMGLTSGTVFLDGKQLHRDFAVLPSLGIVLSVCTLISPVLRTCCTWLSLPEK